MREGLLGTDGSSVVDAAVGSVESVDPAYP